MMLSHGIAGNIQNHKSMLRRQVVRGLIERYGNMQTLSVGADLAWRIAAIEAGIERLSQCQKKRCMVSIS